eukprot:snap_masked-scaffold_7-processed-gene-16.23-mRNA-1 protein AED:1.00 eAED:1.00 QI:0/-1/0/0/-1/1/1/0/665
MSTPEQYLRQQRKQKEEVLENKKKKFRSKNLTGVDLLLQVEEGEEEEDILKKLKNNKKIAAQSYSQLSPDGLERNEVVSIPKLRQRNISRISSKGSRAEERKVEKSVADEEDPHASVRNRFSMNQARFKKLARQNSLESVSRKTGLENGSSSMISRGSRRGTRLQSRKSLALSKKIAVFQGAENPEETNDEKKNDGKTSMVTSIRKMKRSKSALSFKAGSTRTEQALEHPKQSKKVSTNQPGQKLKVYSNTFKQTQETSDEVNHKVEQGAMEIGQVASKTNPTSVAKSKFVGRNTDLNSVSNEKLYKKASLNSTQSKNGKASIHEDTAFRKSQRKFGNVSSFGKSQALGNKSTFVIPKKKEKKEWEQLDSDLKVGFWQHRTILKGKAHYGVALKGWRETMEDTMDVFWSYQKDIPNLFAVYDGHGGQSCSEFCKKFLLKRLAVHSELRSNPRTALADSFLSIDENYSSKFPDSLGGSTASVLYIVPTQKETDEGVHMQYKYFCAVVGDSRVVLVNASGQVFPLSDDHNLTRQDELLRIKKGKGELRYDPDFEELLVYSSSAERGLNVTRSIGDKTFKPLVTAFPEVKEGYLTEDNSYIVIASDGLWGAVENEEVGNIVNEYGARKSAEILQDLANLRGSFDNTTVLVINIQKLVKEMETRILEGV